MEAHIIVSMHVLNVNLSLSYIFIMIRMGKHGAVYFRYFWEGEWDCSVVKEHLTTPFIN